MTDPLAGGLSVVGLVVGFPLLLLGFMLSLEKLEAWGLRNTESAEQELSTTRNTVDAAVSELGQLASANTDTAQVGVESASGGTQAGQVSGGTGTAGSRFTRR